MFVTSVIIITDSAILRVLNVGDNNTGDEGMAIIFEELQHSKLLTTLDVQRCGLSVKGTVCS